MVEIKGAGGKGPDRGSLNLLQGEVEEGPVVGLEFHLPVGGEDLIVTSQIFQGGEAASGVACLGPGIGMQYPNLVKFRIGCAQKIAYIVRVYTNVFIFVANRA